MKLIIMRHGHALMSSPDTERALSEKGKDQVLSTARIIKNKYNVTKILASPYLRAQQTGELLAGELECSIDVMEELVPNGDARAVIDLLPRYGGVPVVSPSVSCGDVLLVSHMPLVSNLAVLLCNRRDNYSMAFLPGSAHVMEVEVRSYDIMKKKGIYLGVISS